MRKSIILLLFLGTITIFQNVIAEFSQDGSTSAVNQTSQNGSTSAVSPSDEFSCENIKGGC